MYYFCFRAVPRHDSPQAAECGGAYINCWLKGGSKREAELEARALIDAEGWIIGYKDDEAQVERAEYDDRPQSLAYFDEAELTGSCYAFHTFPLADVADDEDDDSFDDEHNDQSTPS